VLSSTTSRSRTPDSSGSSLSLGLLGSAGSGLGSAGAFRPFVDSGCRVVSSPDPVAVSGGVSWAGSSGSAGSSGPFVSLGLLGPAGSSGWAGLPDPSGQSGTSGVSGLLDSLGLLGVSGVDFGRWVMSSPDSAAGGGATWGGSSGVSSGRLIR
jgi:hypothetical protein